MLAVRDLLAAPLADARELLVGRMPVPKLLQTDQGGSQVRGKISRNGILQGLAEVLAEVTYKPLSVSQSPRLRRVSSYFFSTCFKLRHVPGSVLSCSGAAAHHHRRASCWRS
jgi:hypothetical protein